MLHPGIDNLPAVKSITYGTHGVGAGVPTSTLNLKTRGGLGRPARGLLVGVGGRIWVRYAQDSSTDVLTAANNEKLDFDISEIGFGTAAVLTSADGAYPAASLGGKTMVVRLDQGTDHDSGNITVTFDNADTTRAAIIARINAAINAALPPDAPFPAVAYAAASSTLKIAITGRSVGSAAKVEVVSVHADVATATGFSAASASGAQFSATGPADDVRVVW